MRFMVTDPPSGWGRRLLRLMTEKPWFDQETDVLLIDEYIVGMDSYQRIVEDGKITDTELLEQTLRVVTLLRQLEEALGMGTFNSTKTFPYSVEDIAPVAKDVMDHFADQDFEVTETNIPTGGVQVSIRKGGTFKAIIGMKTALNIKIEPVANGTTVDAGVGIFGQQAIPTAITLLVFWPVLIAQVWNMAQEARLDEEALRVAEESLKSHSSKAPSGASAE